MDQKFVDTLHRLSINHDIGTYLKEIIIPSYIAVPEEAKSIERGEKKYKLFHSFIRVHAYCSEFMFEDLVVTLSLITGFKHILFVGGCPVGNGFLMILDKFKRRYGIKAMWLDVHGKDDKDEIWRKVNKIDSWEELERFVEVAEIK